MSEMFVPGTVKPEEDYEELGRLSRKLGIPVPMCFVTVESKMPDGSPHERYHNRSRTWNRNFWNKLFSTIPTTSTSYPETFGEGYLNLKDINATAMIATATSYDNIGPLGNANAGIVVGTGSTAESFEGYSLATKIAHGNAAGQLSYSAQNDSTYVYTAGTKLWTASLVRIFNNNSGGSITISETGLYTICYYGNNTIMTCRDVLAASVTVAKGGQLTVTYSILLTFPA